MVFALFNTDFTRFRSTRWVSVCLCDVHIQITILPNSIEIQSEKPPENPHPANKNSPFALGVSSALANFLDAVKTRWNQKQKKWMNLKSFDWNRVQHNNDAHTFASVKSASSTELEYRCSSHVYNDICFIFCIWCRACHGKITRRIPIETKIYGESHGKSKQTKKRTFNFPLLTSMEKWTSVGLVSRMMSKYIQQQEVVVYVYSMG